MNEQIINEVKIMYSLNHENIVKLNNHFEDEKNVYLILEFASGVSFFSHYFKFNTVLFYRANFIKIYTGSQGNDSTKKFVPK